MRRIDYDPDDLNITDEWKQKAIDLTNELINEGCHTERARIINDNSEMWRVIKPDLKKLFYKKCWYTESPQQGTDVDIDHFRPKNRVKELIGSDAPHYGYWWLAFELTNFRYSCIVANRRRTDIETGNTGGKADYFPVKNEDKRARTPNCDLSEERHILLDPCKTSDVRLLTFNENGEAMPRHSKEVHPYLFLRADKSINYYHLNHDDFVKARIELRKELEELRTHAAKFNKKLEANDADHEAAWEKTISDIRKMVGEKAPYSSFCKAYLDSYRNEEYLAGVI